MLRYQVFLCYGIAFLMIWWLLLSQLSTSSSTTTTDNIIGYDIIFVRYLPIWAVLLLGLYAVGSVVYGVIIFKDTPDAATELDQQIKDAKIEMKRRKVITANDDSDDKKKDK